MHFITVNYQINSSLEVINTTVLHRIALYGIALHYIIYVYSICCIVLYFNKMNKTINTFFDEGDESKKESKIYKNLLILRAGDLKTVRLLVKKGARVNAEGDCRYTPLHWAAQNGHVDVVKFLLENGPGLVSARDMWEYTPLHKAARFGHKEIAELLIKSGAAVNQKTKSGYLPLHLAIGNGHKETVNILIQRGGELGAKGANDMDLVRFAETWCPNTACAHSDIASLLYVSTMQLRVSG